MKDVSVVIDGKSVNVQQGKTILEVAEGVGIGIPTLCHRQDLSLEGNCRICVVEVEGTPRLVASCHTPVSEGMVIHTRSARVLKARKVIMELLLAGHTGPCVTDECARECEVHCLAAELEVGPPRFGVRRRRFYPVETISPYVRRDLSRCILCRRCIRACREVAKQDLFDMAYRGFSSKVVTGCDEALNAEVCKDCGICIEYCPTSALLKPSEEVA
ncbi:MAG: 2Fe-2S iron-sulfur cluster-binding protein [Deltaproteobacteria bacterium]|nr:2Fe-2S iron-sulfur cluster-binding protein [Deltaproteobacteria bacterium]